MKTAFPALFVFLATAAPAADFIDTAEVISPTPKSGGFQYRY